MHITRERFEFLDTTRTLNPLIRCSTISSFRKARKKAALYPGFADDVANQPYFVVRRA